MDVKKNLEEEKPMGSITVYGMNQVLALENAVCAAEDMLKALHGNYTVPMFEPRVSIQTVTRDTFRIEVSSQVQCTEKDKELLMYDDADKEES